MLLALVVISVVILMFGFVLLFGPPYLPTLKPQINTAFELLDIPPGGVVLELGSGDGRVLVAAAKRGYRAVGIELNPLLFLVSKLITFKYRNQVKVVWGNMWARPWPEADAIFAFMLPRLMKRLDHEIENWSGRPVKLASHAFRVDSKTASAHKNGVYIYDYR